MSESWGFETKQVHAGAAPDPTTGARAVPIYQTTSYVFRDTSHAAALFGLEELGFIYTRIMNPTQAVFEERMTALEGGVGALATASGQSAETLALLNLGRAGDHLVASASLYGGTYNLLHYTFPKLGWEVTFIDDPDDLDAWRKAIRPNTRAFYGESVGNPKNDVFDFEGVSAIGHAEGIPLIIDNTVTTPFLCRPLDWGADVVVHSATKFIGGHGTSIGGIIVDGGKFDYVASGRHPTFTEPDPSYHGLVYSQLPDELRPAEYILKTRLQLQRDLGPAIAPLNSFLFLQGLETLSLRMERHCQNAQAVAEWFEARDEVEWVAYPGLPSSKWYERGEQVPPARQGRHPRLRDQRWARSGSQLRRRARAVQPSRERRRRPQPRDPPRVDDALPAHRSRAGHDRRDGGPRAPVRRHRDDRRHPRRPRSGLPRCEGRVTRRLGPRSPPLVPGAPATSRGVASS